ncbi:MAG: hypothetical protein LBJ00_04430 [Planctomycetaceae bacterium]|jgi:hypothetical protein|nr:hypothetical protein [Planctomycetaceae bacterium]
MKLHFRLVFALLVGYIAFSAIQTAYAQSVQNLSATANGPIYVNVTWTGSIHSYKVYANEALKTSGVVLPGDSGINHSASFLTTPSTSHNVKVYGYDKYGSLTGTATTYVNTPTNVPSGVTASNWGTGQVKVRWNSMYMMTTYKVYRSSDNGVTWITSYSGPGNLSAEELDKRSAIFSCPAGQYKFAVTSASNTTTESSKSAPADLNVQ